MDKKNNLSIIIIIIVVIALIALIILKNNITKKVKEAPLDQNQIELQNAVKSDKTTDITTSIDNIKIEDTIDTDLNTVDKELENL